jgi:hypothetical protein
MKGIKRFEFLLIFVSMSLVLGIGADTASALEENEVEKLEAEIDKIEMEDPELAKALREEFRESVARGEIDMPEKGEYDRGRPREGGPDMEGMEKEFQDLIKSGKNPEEAEKIMREKYGGPDDFEKPDLSTAEGKAEALEKLSEGREFLLKDGFTEQEIKEIEEKISRGEDPREIFERHGDFEAGPHDFDRGPGDFDRAFDRGGPERELTKEEMEREFMREMGREPTEQEREMMERGDFEREGFEREMMEREGFEREGFEREMMEREFEKEREGFEREREGFEREREQREREERPAPPPPPEE